LVVEIYENPIFARTELTVRLEHAFLTGLCFDVPRLRNRFATIFHRSVGRSLYARLHYLLAVQHWDSIASRFWITQAVDLVLAGALADAPLAMSSPPTGSDLRVPSLRQLLALQHDLSANEPAVQASTMQLDNDGAGKDPLYQLLREQQTLMSELRALRLGDLARPLRQLTHLSVQAAHDTWVELFAQCWPLLTAKERHDCSKALAPLLANPYQSQQAADRPNVVQALLEGAARCRPAIRLPPQLVKYLAKNFGAWHVAIEQLERSYSTADPAVLDEVNRSEELIRESTLDALSELYEQLAEDDLACGLWRRRCMFSETNAALSFEQCSVWPVAQQMYEQAQLKARSGIQAFTEAEYTLWEEHWIRTTEQLQQWDILHDLSRHEGNPELQLEAAWRQLDIQQQQQQQGEYEAMVRCIRALPETPRRKAIEAFLLLQEPASSETDRAGLFHGLCNEGMQLALQRWHALPSVVHQSHTPLLHAFQMFVELQEAGQMCTLLLDTNAGNFDTRFQELKSLLQSWRERLPNYWDDMNQWSDLSAWRQLMFGAVNRVYLPLGPLLPQNATPSGGVTNSSLAFRGYHEMAWIINRFARVARKHGMLDVCSNQLARIYTLPNIEIQEAFIKLKEQARCNLKNPGELSSGLEVINNTNLTYFGDRQKAEFFTLKGDFLARLERNDEANTAYSAAVNAALNLPKAWASWGRFLDGLFRDRPDEIQYATRAIDCYLQACCLQRSPKSRRHIARVLWLLAADDEQGSVAKTFETFKGDVAIWYWLTFIPQLLTSLSGRAARHARLVLERIAKAFPQALHYQLRTMREEYEIVLRRSRKGRGSRSTASENAGSDGATKDAADGTEASDPDASTTMQRTPSGNPIAGGPSAVAATPAVHREHPWEHIDDIMSILKSTNPLLALTIETMIDQILQRLKPTSEEDMYRLLVALLTDGIQVCVMVDIASDKDQSLSSASITNINRIADMLPAGDLKVSFDTHFIHDVPTLPEYVRRLREWRDSFGAMLVERPTRQPLESYSHYLTEFEHQRFDDVEVPGQYTLLKDNNDDFVRIERFEPTVVTTLQQSSYVRHLTMRGHNGSPHSFVVQHPSPRSCRREERLAQLFRMMNSILERRLETRRRSLSFHLPFTVPLAPQVRLVQLDHSYVTMHDILEAQLGRDGVRRDEPVFRYIDLLTELTADGKHDVTGLKYEITELISTALVPSDTLTRYFSRIMSSPTDLWMLRKRFTTQLAASAFLTHTLGVNGRSPHKYHVSRTTGNIWTAELFPCMCALTQDFATTDAVPFRLTPNLQHFITPSGIEGTFSASLMCIANAFVESRAEVDDLLGIFVRDELSAWNTSSIRPTFIATPAEGHAANNAAGTAAPNAPSVTDMPPDAMLVPLNQSILDLVAQATNPQKMAQMGCVWMPWF
ncbi:phosphatidylinositol kinase, partial [Thamnocephalis sphaerospora]